MSSPLQPGPQFPGHVAPAPRPKRRFPLWARIVGGVVGLLVLLSIVGAIVGPSQSVRPAAAARVTVTATPTQVIATTTVTAPPVTETATVTVAPPTVTTVVTQTYTPPPVNQFTDGTQQVGSDIPPGVYKTNGQGDSGSCYFAILNSLNNQDIASNNNFDGPTSVRLVRGKVFETSGGCAWSKIG